MELLTTLRSLRRPVSRLVMGTSFWCSMDQAEADRLFDSFMEKGGNCFDTSLVYYDVEVTLGNWIRKRQNRDRVVVHAKGAHHETVSTKNNCFEYHRMRVTPDAIREDLDETLRRLQTDFVDMYTLHRDDPDWPVGPIIETLAIEQQRGRIRAFGASNWSIPRLEEANAYATAKGLPGFSVSSPNLALGFANEASWPNCITACDRASREWYAKTQMPLFAWSCLALGFFSGEYHEDFSQAEFDKWMADRWTADVVRVYFSKRNFQRLERVRSMAEQKSVTPTQLALAWVLHQGPNIFAVAGPRTESELNQLFGAFQLNLSPDEVAWLNLERN